MEIEQLRWDGGNEPHLRTHGIGRADVEDLVFWGTWVRARNTRYPNQIRIIGYTPAGRWLTIALERTEMPGAWRPITGWPTTEREIDYFAARRRSG